MKLEIHSEKFNDVLISHGVNFEDERGAFKKVIFGDELMNLMGSIYELMTVKSKKNVIRGLHFQKTPHPVSKFITCTKGEILDVFLDIRQDSDNYGEYGIYKLNEKDSSGIFIPEGYAHGYSVISDEAIVVYLQSDNYFEDLDGSINPTSIDIDWEVKNPIISKKDQDAIKFEKFKTCF